LTQIPAFVLIFFTNLFITLIVKAEGKGVISIFQADIDLFVLFFSFAITTAVVYFVSSKTIKVEKLLAVGLILIGFGLVLLILLLVIIKFFFVKSFVFPSNYNQSFHYWYIIISFTIINFNSLLLSFFQGISNFRIINFITILNGCLNFIVFGVCYFIYKNQYNEIQINDILLISMCLVLVNFVIHIFLFVKFFNVWPDFKLRFKEEIKPVLVFISLGHLAYMVSFITYRIDYWIVEYYNGVEELGYYAQAVGMGQMFWYVSNPIVTVLSPFLSDEHSKDRINTLKFFSRINFSLTFILLLIACLFAGYIFPIYGSQFSNSVLPFRIISFGILMASVSKVLAVYFVANNKIIYNLIASITGMVVAITLDFILIPLYGKIGASIATSISYLTITFVVIIFLKSKFDLNLRNILIVTKDDLSVIRKKITIS
jgi:O-antigen/teichoic acid export membrane protein